MMRLPFFRYRAPRTVREAAEMLADTSADTMLVAGGTDLLPNMKRRQQVPATLIGLRNVAELRGISNGEGLTVGAGVTLAALLRNTDVRAGYTALWQAAAQVATPPLRNMGTIGGNLCLDTRCNYYDQNYEWRKAIGFCMKKDGAICWVAPSSSRCLAVSSADTVPALLALGATITLTSADGIRQIPVASLYRNDGIDYLTRAPEEIRERDAGSQRIRVIRRRVERARPMRLRRIDVLGATVVEDRMVERSRARGGIEFGDGFGERNRIEPAGCPVGGGRPRRPTSDRRRDRTRGRRCGTAGAADGQYRFHAALAQTSHPRFRQLRVAGDPRRRHAGRPSPRGTTDADVK